jgi:hypothetical protein
MITDLADMLSTGQQQLIRRALMISAECARLESLALRGERIERESWGTEINERFDIGTYIATANTLLRLFQAIGLERKAKLVVESDVVAHFRKRTQRPAP